ncbi:MAG: hypothetical protein K0S33_2410 [Bacteroidetes bacterium]|jgi:lipopolysaccharide biosynthesis protein|nr:hypothetical protein [Bacteroidota bacterium]
MNSICFFASYFNGERIPYYIRFYLHEFKKQFTKVVFVSGNPVLDEESKAFLTSHDIQLMQEKNEGFDFGLWYKALQKHSIDTYEQVALINDSAVLVKPLDEFFDWMKTVKADVYGMTESAAVSRHLQSYFLVLNKNTLPLLKDYFEKNGIKKTIGEVISTYEIGLSTFLLQKGYHLAAYMGNKNYRGEFSPYYYLLKDHIRQGVPLIKKKIIYSSYRKQELGTLARMNFETDPEVYIDLIKQANKDRVLIDFDRLKRDAVQGMTGSDRFMYALKRLFYTIFRPVYRLIKNK